jgi:uncharacterized protein with HEPN domain
MLDPKDTVRLRHMLDHAREAVSLAQSKTRSDLDQDRLLQLALVRLIEIVGEAASRVTRETQSQYPQILWPQVIGMRNRLVHGYDSVDYNILWQTIERDLPSLITNLQQINTESEG